MRFLLRTKVMDLPLSTVPKLPPPDSNNSNSLAITDYTSEPDWIAALVANIVSFFATVWTTLSLVHFGLKTGKWRQMRRDNSEKLSIGLVYSSVIACSVACSAYYICTTIYLNVGFTPEEDFFCEVLGDICINIHGGVVLSVYMFLWLRQRVFFTNGMLNVQYSILVRVCSFFSIFVIFAAGVSITLCVNLPKNHHWSGIGCVFRPSDDLILGYWVSVIVYNVLGQVTLLGLFFYALQSSKKIDPTATISVWFCCQYMIQTLRSTPKSSQQEMSYREPSSADISHNELSSRVSTQVNSSKSISRSSVYRSKDQINAVRTIIRKTLLFAILSILAELINQIGMYYLTQQSDSGRIDIIIGNVNIFLNLLFCLLSFVNVRNMVFSFCRQKK